MIAIALTFAIAAYGPASWEAASALRTALAQVPCLREAAPGQPAAITITAETRYLPAWAGAHSGSVWVSTSGIHTVTVRAFDAGQEVFRHTASSPELAVGISAGNIWIRLPAGGPGQAAAAAARAAAQFLASRCRIPPQPQPAPVPEQDQGPAS